MTIFHLLIIYITTIFSEPTCQLDPSLGFFCGVFFPMKTEIGVYILAALSTL